MKHGAVTHSWSGGFVRWLKFSTVGVLGIGVQLAALATMREWTPLHYLVATALAVETAVLHNFCWHIRWTWAAQSAGATAADLLWRLVKFHMGAGAVSLITNVLLMRWLVGALGMHYLPANLLSIAAASALNFLISELMVFLPVRPGRAGSV